MHKILTNPSVLLHLPLQSVDAVVPGQKSSKRKSTPLHLNLPRQLSTSLSALICPYSNNEVSNDIEDNLKSFLQRPSMLTVYQFQERVFFSYAPKDIDDIQDCNAWCVLLMRREKQIIKAQCLTYLQWYFWLSKIKKKKEREALTCQTHFLLICLLIDKSLFVPSVLSDIDQFLPSRKQQVNADPITWSRK